MAAVQEANLNDVYAKTFYTVLGGILANPEFHTERMTTSSLMDKVELLALAAINRINVKTGDFSVVTPPISGFTGQNLGVNAFTISTAPPAVTYVPPSVVKQADGSQA